METLNRNNYYFDTKEDVKLTFIDYGRYLEKKNIIQDDFNYYERYLQEKYEAEECEQYQKEFYNNVPQKTIEYTEFLCFILEQTEWQNDLIIIKQEEWDRFWNSKDSDEKDMDLIIVQAKDFYDEFEKITGIDHWKFEECFVSTKYIDERTYNTMNLIIDVDGKRERFIIDVA